jgi:putative transposase
MDWSTRKVLSWRVSNTMDGEFCIEALEDALARFGCPEIFNTDSKSDGVGKLRRSVVAKRWMA